MACAGSLDEDPLAGALWKFTEDARDSDSDDDVGAAGPNDAGASRDDRVVSGATARAAGREAFVAASPGLANREDVWGGGLRRMVYGCVGPRREDGHFFAGRYVPVGFARYVDPTVDPADYKFYSLSGWRVAVPRTVEGPAVRLLLLRIYKYGPGAAGYARLGDTLVPAILGPGDRQTLTEAVAGYPMA